MGLHFISPVHAGIRQRDDYGAAAGTFFTHACQSVTLFKNSSRIARSFPVVQSRTIDAIGRLNHVA